MSAERTQTLQIRLSPDELERLRRHAEHQGLAMAQVLRLLIRQLPDHPDRSG